MKSRFTHEYQFYEWLSQDFPSFRTKEGKEILKLRVDDIMIEIDNYFYPEYMERSANAKYLKEDIEAVRKAYKEDNLDELCLALELFKSGCQYI